MKNLTLTILFACLALFAKAQHSYIECTGDVILEAGSIEIYGSPYIYVESTSRSLAGTWVVTLQLSPTLVISAADGVPSVKTYQIEFDEATIDALTCTGATNSEDIKNCLLQAVADYLEALNGGTTFTLN